jgi:hypothetical protein
MDANASLPLSRCLSEIASRGVPWAGDPGANFDTGLFAVLDHVDDGALALLYFRPEDHEFLVYVYTATHDERVAHEVAEDVTRYLQSAETIFGTPRDGDASPGAVLWELDREEARRRIDQLRRVLARPGEDVGPSALH